MHRQFRLLGLAAAVLTLSFAPAPRPQVGAQAQTPPKVCPDPKKLRFMCGWVGGHAEGKAGNRYRYQDDIYAAACTDAKAPDRNAKVQQLWRMSQTRLMCNSPSFAVTDGSILKFAAAGGLSALIYDATSWGVPLNKVDRSDGKTVLDYVEDGLVRLKGSPLEEDYAAYRRTLLAAGAKHARDVTPAERAADAQAELAETRARAEAGETAYMLKVAAHYRDGYGAPADRAEALRWLQRAADAALAKSHEDAAWAAFNMVDLDLPRALRVYEQASAYSWRAAEQLGDLYARGQKVPKDDAQAARWYAQADQLGPGTDASVKLGLLYVQGRGVPRDADRGAALLMKNWMQPNARAWLCTNRRGLIEGAHPGSC